MFRIIDDFLQPLKLKDCSTNSVHVSEIIITAVFLAVRIRISMKAIVMPQVTIDNVRSGTSLDCQ